MRYPPKARKDTKEGKEYYFVRRVIALGGEEVSLTKRQVHINGKSLLEVERGALWEKKIQEYYKKIPSLINKTAHWESFPKLRVKEGEIFVLADKRIGALDSRLLGTFSFEDIEGIIKE